MLIRPLFNKCCLLLLVISLFFNVTVLAGAAGIKDLLIKINFGGKNLVKYNLKSGTYDVIFNGKPVITGAYVSCKGKVEFDSRHAGTAKFSSPYFPDLKKKVFLFTYDHQGIRVQHEFYFFSNETFFCSRVKVKGKEVAANYISPLTNAKVAVDGTGDNRALYVPFDNDMWARFNAQPFAQANFTGSEVTALYNNDNNRGLVIGSVEHTTWKTGITIKADSNNTAVLTAFGGFADNKITHDNISHGAVTSGDTLCSSPLMLIGYYSDWRDGMEKYATVNRQYQPQAIFNWSGSTPIGWNSWGIIQDKITLNKAKAVIDFFSDSCKNFRSADGSLYIDLDSFWDNMIKGGINGDVEELKQFVQYCKSKGFKPGIYWAPFTDWGKHDRKMEGSEHTYAQAWLKQNGKPVEVDGAYALDATHPGTQARIALYLGRLKELGFEMIKIDFLGHGALECDRFYDNAVTTGMQAYKIGMDRVVKALDNKMLVYAAISPTMATAPYVHMRRIACDAFSAIDNTEYTLNSTGYGWWQSHLYNFVDADHVVFNRESEGANRARMASALVTGTLIAGDDFSTNGPWTNTAKRLLQHKGLLNIIKDGRSFRPVEANTGNRGVELFIKSNGTLSALLAVFNYSNTPQTITLPLSRLGFESWRLYSGVDYFTKTILSWSNDIRITIPPSDAMIYSIGCH